MDDSKRRDSAEKRENDIIFSKAIKAGKRIYYLDVKKNKKNELYLAITESKKVMINSADESSFQFEKHKIFLYKEDFDKFANGFAEVFDFVKIHNFSASEVPVEEVSDEECEQY